MQSGTWSQSGSHVNLVNVRLLSSFWKWNQSGEMNNIVIQIGWPSHFEASGQRLPDCILQSGKGKCQIEDQSGKARFARLHFTIWLHRKQSGNLAIWRSNLARLLSPGQFLFWAAGGGGARSPPPTSALVSFALSQSAVASARPRRTSSAG